MNLQLHHFVPISYANGPGARVVVWVQGCTLGCPNCFNPETHPANSGQQLSVDTLFAQIVALGDQIEGVTISGGEPLQQSDAVVALLQRIKAETSLSVVLFTGFYRHEIERMASHALLLGCVDVLIAGRYDPTKHRGDALLGSGNQTVELLSERYSRAEVDATPPTEIIIMPGGRVIVSGIDPVLLE